MFCNTLRAAGGEQDITPVLLALSWKALLTLPCSAPMTRHPFTEPPLPQTRVMSPDSDVPALGRGNTGGAEGVPEQTPRRTHAHGALDAHASPGTHGTIATKFLCQGHGPKSGRHPGLLLVPLPQAACQDRTPASRGKMYRAPLLHREGRGLAPGSCWGHFASSPGGTGGAGGGGISPAGSARTRGLARRRWHRCGSARERRCPARAPRAARTAAGSPVPTAGAEPRPGRQSRRPPP